MVDAAPVGVDPEAITVGAGSVWAANTADETISRIDPRTHRTVATIPVGEYPSDVAVAAGSAWVALGGLAGIRRLALDRNEADESFPATASASVPCARSRTGLTAGGGALWLACTTLATSSDASRINLRTKRVVRVDEALVSSSPVGVAFSDVAFGLGSVWIANRLSNAVTQIDARGLRNVREVAVGRSPEAVAVGFGSVWVANAEDDTVSRFAVGRREEPVIVETIPVGDKPVDVAVGESAVWVVNRGDRTLSRIDPATNKVVATVSLANEPIRVAASDGLVWVTVQEAS